MQANGDVDVDEAALAQALKGYDSIVFASGGVVLDPRNMDALAASALLVCLTLSPEETYARIRHDSSRPLLQHPDPLVRIRELQIERAPLYARIPFQINRDSLPPQQTADAILKLYQAAI